MMNSANYLIEILEFYIYKLKNGKCTTAEMDSATAVIVQNMNTESTISDLSKFYGKPESQIRATIARKLIAKPKRKLLYSFQKFAKVVPETWKKKGE